MPSLRRTISSPSVRQSPYQSASSTRGQQRRCSEGPIVSTRRVLADIDWWRVVDGQRGETGINEDAEGENRPEGDVRGAVVERPATPRFDEAEVGRTLAEEQPQAVYSQYPVLPITPRTPARRQASDRSNSSVESSPSSEGPYTPREASFTLADFGFADPGIDDDLPFRMRPQALGMVKSFSFSAFTTPRKETDENASPFGSLGDAAHIHDNDLFA